MVLENWVRGKIHELLGHYIEIDRESLKIGVWDGNLVLDNLRLLPGPVPGSPICVVSGSLRRLELIVPWKNLKRKPVIIRVEDLEVVYGPRGAITPEERRAEADRALERKRELLRTLDGEAGAAPTDDEAGSNAAEEDALAAEEAEEDSSFMERLTGTILRNVEITMHNVRMIYRDSTTVPAHPFELVASMGSLGIQSCDGNWSPAVVAPAEDETSSQLFRKLVTLSDLSVSFECGGVREELLRPLTAELKMENYAEGEQPRRSSAGGRRPEGVARHTFRLSLDQVELRLSKPALVCCVQLAQRSDVRAYLAYLQYRPAQRPSAGGSAAREWWQYAKRGVCYAPEGRDKALAQKRWTDLSWQVGARAEYLKLYKTIRRRPVAGLNYQPEPASAADVAALQALDDRFETRSILLFRRVAMAELHVERNTTKEALRSYKRVKEDAMGSGLARMKMKASMSKEDYAALKPFKPTEIMDATREQRRAIFQELGVGKEEDIDLRLAEAATQIDVQISLGSTAVAVRDDPADPLDKLLFRIGKTNARVQIRTASQRIECQVASVVLLDELSADEGGSSWHDGQALSILPAGAPGGKAIVLMADTLGGPSGHGDVECIIAPVSAVYSKPAHIFVLGLADELVQQVDETFVSKARSRVAQFTERAKNQLKSRLHKTQTRSFSIAVAAVTLTLPLDISDETSPAMRVAFEDLAVKSRRTKGVADLAPSSPDKAADTAEGSSRSKRALSPKAGSLGSDLADRLYQRFDIMCGGAQASMLTERSQPAQDVVAPCKVAAEIAVMLVEEIEIDGESLTASLPWYEATVTVEGLGIRLTADQLPVATAIVQTVHTRPSVAQPRRQQIASGADTVWPMHTKLQVGFDEVAVELRTDDTVIAGRIEKVQVESKVDFGQQSWTTAEVNSLVVWSQYDSYEKQTLLMTGAGSDRPDEKEGRAISVKMTNAYGSSKLACDVSLGVTFRSTCTIGVPRASIMRQFIPGLREFCDLIVLPPSPVMVSPRATEVPDGSRNFEVALHSLSVSLPIDDQQKDLLVLTANSVVLKQETFGTEVSYQCKVADVGLHTDEELECSTGEQLPGSFFRCGHRGVSVGVDTMFSADEGQFVIKGLVVRLSGIYFLLSNSFQARAAEYITRWREVLGLPEPEPELEPEPEPEPQSVEELIDASDSAADLVRAAQLERLEKLKPQPVVLELTEDGVSEQPFSVLAQANIDFQMDEFQLVLPSTKVGDGVVLDIESFRLTKPARAGSVGNMDMPNVQIFSLRNGAPDVPMLERAVSIALAMSLSPAPPVATPRGTRRLKLATVECNLSAIDIHGTKTKMGDLDDVVRFFKQSTIVSRIRRSEQKVQFKFAVTCPSLTLATLNDRGEDFVTFDALDVQLNVDSAEVALEVAGLCAACVVEGGETVDFLQLEEAESALASAAVIHFTKGEQPRLTVQLGDLEFIASPEVVRALTVPNYADVGRGCDPTSSAFEQHTPYGNDFVLTQDDLITCDMAFTATQRLFVRGQPGDMITLKGNGYSLRFDDTDSAPIVFVSPGTCLCLDDTVLEGWNSELVVLGTGSRILGDVVLVDETPPSPVPQSPRYLPAGLISKMRSASKPMPSPLALSEDPLPSPMASEPAEEDKPHPAAAAVPSLVPIEMMVASCKVRFIVPSVAKTPPGKHQRAQSEDRRSDPRPAPIRLRTNSVDTEHSTDIGARGHRRAPSMNSRRSYSIDTSARLKLSYKPTTEGMDTRMVVDAFSCSVSSIVDGKAVLSTTLNEPLTVVLESSVDQSRAKHSCEIVDGIVIRMTSDSISRAGYVVLCAGELLEEVGQQNGQATPSPDGAAASSLLKDSPLQISSITISSIVIEMVDGSGVPFFRSSLLNCFSQISYAYPSRDMFLRVVGSADCFNGAISDWEPLVERCHVFVVAKHTDDHDADRSDVELNIRSANGIMVNLTRNAVAMNTDALLPWYAAIRMRDPDALALVTPELSYTIRNDTRLTVCLRLPTPRGLVDCEVLPAEKIQYDGASLVESGAKRVHLECDGCTGSITLDRVGVSHLLLESEDGSRHVHIGVHVVQMQATTKRIYIRSEVFVRNETAVRVAMKLGRRADSPVVVIEPFSKATCALQDVIAVAPCDADGEATHEWVRVHDVQVANDRSGFVSDRVQLVTCTPLRDLADGGVLLEGKLQQYKAAKGSARGGRSSTTASDGGWKERYVELHAGGAMTYMPLRYLPEFGNAKKDPVRILPVSVEASATDDCLFVVTSDHDRAYTFAAENTDVRAAWIEAVSSQLQAKAAAKPVEEQEEEVDMGSKRQFVGQELEPEPAPEPEPEPEPEPAPEPEPLIEKRRRNTSRDPIVKREVSLLWNCEDGSVADGPSSYRIQAPVTIQNRLPCQVKAEFFFKRFDPKDMYKLEHMPACTLDAGEDLDLHYASSVLMRLNVSNFSRSLDTVVDTPGEILVQDPSGRTLRIQMDSDTTQEGRCVVTIYASTWLVNYTGLPLRYRRQDTTPLAGVPDEGVISQRPSLCDAQTIQVSVVGELNMFASHPDDTAWSQPFTLTTVGTTGAVSIEDLPRMDGIPQHRYDLVVANRLGKGKYRRTRIVAISAQYQLLNHLEQPLYYIQADKKALRAAAGGLAVPPHVSTPVYFRNASGRTHLYLRTDSAAHGRWSSGVALDSACNLALAIPDGCQQEGDAPVEGDTSEHVVRLDCQEPGASGSQILLVRSFERERPGYLVENHTSYSLCLWQHGLVPPVGHQLRTLNIDPHRAEPFVWEQPLMKQLVKVEILGSINPENGLQDRLQLLASFDDFVEREPMHWATVNAQVLTQVRVRGGTKVLRISTRPGLAATPAVPMPPLPPSMTAVPEDAGDPPPTDAPEPAMANSRTGLTRQKSIFERQTRPLFLDIEVALPSLQVVVVDRSPGPRELFALCLSDLKLCADVQIGKDMKLDASIMAVQIEDASPLARFPVIFGATHTQSDVTTPFLQLSLIRSLEDASSHSYPFISLLMQAGSLTLEDTFLSQAVSFFYTTDVLLGGKQQEEQNQQVSPSKTNSQQTKTPVARGAVWDADGSMEKFSTDATELVDVKPMYCKVLQLHPVQIQVTFVTSGVSGLPGVPAFLSDVEDAMLRLDALVLENTHTTPNRLTQAVAARYRQQLSYEFYKMIGTADLLGNPIGLIDSLATGVFALFYEPAAAVFKHPADITIEDLAGGLAKGMGALLHNSIHAPMNSVSKVTGTVSKSMAMLSGDEEYVLSRSTSRRRANMRSGHLGHGLRAGGEGLAKGIVKGLGGLVTAPALAVQKEGIWGLGGGFAKGLTGAVVKPAVGAIDMAEGLTTGIRNTATIINTAAGRGAGERRRLRPPRAPTGQADGRATLAEYDGALARGYAALKATENVVAHSRRGGAGAADDGEGVRGGGIVMLTDTRLLLLDDEDDKPPAKSLATGANPTVTSITLSTINSVARSPPGSDCGVMVRTKPVPATWIESWKGSVGEVGLQEDPQGVTIFVQLGEEDVDEFCAIVSAQMGRMAGRK